MRIKYHSNNLKDLKKGNEVKFSINQKELQNAISVVSKGVSSKTTLPILSGIFIEAKKDSLTFQATDLVLSIKYNTDALIENEGKIVVPGRLFSEIVKNLPDAAVSLELSDQDLIIMCDASSFSIKTLNPEDFPTFPEVSASQEITLPFSTFSHMVKKVARVVSKDESRAVLTGVLITFKEKTLQMVATDSYRLAIAEKELENSQQEEFEAVISGKFLQDIISLPQTDSQITLALSENQIIITYKDTIFINRRLEGNFPNYKQLLPDNYNTRIELETNRLNEAVKRVSTLDIKTAPIKIDINIASQTVQLSSVAQDIGSSQETLSGEATGEDVVIAFNHGYIIEGLSSIETENVFLEIQNTNKPGIFRAGGEENFFYLIMPVRIQ